MRKVKLLATAFTVSAVGLAFIAKKEGDGPTIPNPETATITSPEDAKVVVSYKDIAGVWTICHGHTGGVKKDQTATFSQCRQYLREDSGWAGELVAKWVKVAITQEQYDAMVSLIYNVGPGIPGKRSGIIWLKDGRHSTLLNKVNAGDCLGAGAEFLKWSKVGNVPVKGLLIRRQEEKAMFESGCGV